MGKSIFIKLLQVLLVLSATSTTLNSEILYNMPEETAQHEGTWLQWPHQYTYGMYYRNSLDQTWVDMTAALVDNEKVHIVAYNNTQKSRIEGLLNSAGVSLTNVDFSIFPTDDVWMRDNGPMYVTNSDNELTILDWGFNGWGNDAPFSLCEIIPTSIATEQGYPVVDLDDMVLEGGAIEHDGRGTMMATRSSVTHSSRNPLLSEAEIEEYITTYMGITNFLWLDGVYGLEITDMHIDGFMKFANENTIVTMNNEDLLYWDLIQSDIDILYSATDVDDIAYEFVIIPLTQDNVTTLYGNDLGYQGSYANYYIANNVVLVPNYDDPNDSVANDIIQSIYPDRTVIGIDVRNLYENGGMVHCVVQQQPYIDETSLISEITDIDYKLSQNYPNPFNPITTISYFLPSSENIKLTIYNSIGNEVTSLVNGQQKEGSHQVKFDASNLATGIYKYQLSINNKIIDSKTMVLIK